MSTVPVTADERAHIRRAVIASTVGTAIEWYDFFLYSTVTGLVFAKVFFPTSDPLTGTLNAFGIYAVGFVARPIGAAIFGHYGDRIGRKTTLIATLILMGVGTFLVGFVPGYASIGIWGAVILSVLRFVQGVGVGGEWGGSVLMSLEWGHKGRRGFLASWPQFGVPCGLFLANVAVLVFSAISGSNFINWGWRIPFFLSIVLVGVGLYIRLGILETPLFQRLPEQSPFYIFTAFIYAYGTGALKQSQNFLLIAVLCASLVSFVSIPFFGHLSDIMGRKRVYLSGVVLMGVFGFVWIGLLGTLVPALIFVAIVVSLIPHDMQYGPQAALIAESFTGRLRYSGASLGYQLASVIAGGPAPLIATALFAAYKTGYAIAGYILVCSVIGFIATALLTERSKQDISVEYDAPAGAPAPA